MAPDNPIDVHELRKRIDPNYEKPSNNGVWTTEQTTQLIGAARQSERLATSLTHYTSNPSYFEEKVPAWAVNVVKGDNKEHDFLYAEARVEVATNNIVNDPKIGGMRNLETHQTIGSILNRAAKIDPDIHPLVHSSLANIDHPSWLKDNRSFRQVLFALDQEINSWESKSEDGSRPISVSEQHHRLAAYQALIYEAYMQGDVSRDESARAYTATLIDKIIHDDIQTPNLSELEKFTAIVGALNAKKSENGRLTTKQSSTPKPKQFEPAPKTKTSST